MIRTQKSLGQNFLHDDEIAARIAAEVPAGSTVLEIGAGDGALTKQLLDSSFRVLAVEIDQRLAERLSRRLKHRRDFIPIAANILELDWSNLGEAYDELVVVGNLPYHLASAILFRVFDHVRSCERPLVKQMIVMVQREVGRRITSSPNTRIYGSLSLLVQWHGIPEYLFTVPADRFRPKPKVDGAVVRITIHRDGEFPEVSYAAFRRIVRGCFAQRRKMMRNALGVLTDLPPGWRDLSLDFSRRPEQLSLDEFVGLTRDIEELTLSPVSAPSPTL